jgi:hypothetical protein
VKQGALSALALAFLPRLAYLTMAFSGADLAGLLREAKSLALARALEPPNLLSLSSTLQPSGVLPTEQLGGPEAGGATPGVSVSSTLGAPEPDPGEVEGGSGRGEGAAMVRKGDLWEAVIAELARRERRGEPCVSVEMARREREAAQAPLASPLEVENKDT